MQQGQGRSNTDTKYDMSVAGKTLPFTGVAAGGTPEQGFAGSF